MNELIISFDETVLYSFLLAATRSAAWLFITPPFGRNIPARVRAGMAFALALPMSRTDAGEIPAGTLGLAADVAFQALVGVALGFIVLAFFSVFSLAGSVIDFTAGFTAATSFDIMTGASVAIVSRMYVVVATALVFTTGGHLVIVNGYMRAYQAAPLSGPSFDSLGATALDNIAWLFVAALELAFPVVAALFLVELGLGLVARAAPQTNVLTIGFALKTGVAMLVLAYSIHLLPAAVEVVVGRAVGATV